MPEDGPTWDAEHTGQAALGCCHRQAPPPPQHAAALGAGQFCGACGGCRASLPLGAGAARRGHKAALLVMITTQGNDRSADEGPWGFGQKRAQGASTGDSRHSRAQISFQSPVCPLLVGLAPTSTTRDSRRAGKAALRDFMPATKGPSPSYRDLYALNSDLHARRGRTTQLARAPVIDRPHARMGVGHRRQPCGCRRCVRNRRRQPHAFAACALLAAACALLDFAVMTTPGQDRATCNSLQVAQSGLPPSCRTVLCGS